MNLRSIKTIALSGLGFTSLATAVLAADLADVPASIAKDATSTLTNSAMGAVIVIQFLFMVWLIMIIGSERKAEREERVAKDDKLTKSLEGLTSAIREALTADKISDKIVDQLRAGDDGRDKRGR